MEIAFVILVAMLVAVSIWEFYAGKVLDIAFSGILASRREAKRKFLRIIAVQLVVWIFLLLLIFLTYAIIFKSRFADVQRIRTYLLIIFVLVVFPIALIRKKFAAWVAARVAHNKAN